VLTGSRRAVTAIALIVAASMAACASSDRTPTVPAVPSSTAVSVETAAPIVTAAPGDSAPGVVALPTTLPAPMTYDQIAPLLAYDASPAFDITVGSTRHDSGATIEDIAYTGAAHESIQAYLILPDGAGPFPAVLYEHGQDGDRSQFFAEASALAQQRHIAGLVVTRPGGLDDGGDDHVAMLLQVREMRRALDLLQAQPQVDKTRLAYVGWSQGAIYGVTLLSIETRVRTAVLMAVVPGFDDADTTAPHVTLPSVLLQFGTQDDFYTRTSAEGFASTIPATHKVSWYEAPHELNDAATADRATWLAAKLGAK
jgi:dienelactone hydrolase